MLPFHANKKNTPSKKTPLIVAGFFALLIICVMLFPTVRSKTGGFFLTIFSPVYKIKNAIGGGLHNTKSFFLSKKSLQHENDALKNKVTELDSFRVENIVLQEENTSLKKTLGRVSVRKRILATVLSSNTVSMYDSLTIDIGSADGIKEGDLVLSGEIVLGKVTTLYEHNAQVALLSASGNQFEALLVDTGTVFSVKGKGGGSFEFVVPRGMTVQNGMTLVLPALHSYPIAQVGGIVSNEHESFKLTLARAPVNIGSLHFIEVETQ